MRNNKKYKLVLINPLNKRRKGFLGDKRLIYPPISLGILAALTPAHWEVKILDEQMQEFVFEEADLVGITALTAQATRAYEIAGIYRAQNIPVVIGGIHASSLPDEAGRYADAVVMSEAENIWGKVIEDFENNRLQRKYQGVLQLLHNSPIPRHDLFHSGYAFSSVQTTRGCPMQCEFCSVHTFNGQKYRTRPIADVLDEMELIPHEHMVIVDDNLIGYNKKSQQRTIELFKGMIERKINKEWFAQVSLNFADNAEVLKYAFEAGCRMVFMGVESEKKEQLKEQRKSLNLKYVEDQYYSVFRKIQENGIAVTGTIMFGLDTDSVEDLHNRADFIEKSNLNSYQTSIISPMPGTRLYDKFIRENRITETNYPQDWEKYHGMESIITPKKMTAEELEENMKQIWTRIYSRKNIMKKFLETMKSTRCKTSALWSISTNINYHNIALEPWGMEYKGSDILKDEQIP